jgi:hypothetical protein
MRVIGFFIAAAYFGAGCDGGFGLTKIRGSGDDIGPDAPSCANAVGHDEDLDSLDDGCDPCPFSAANDGDTDGDGIASACDPDPALKNEVLLFEGFGPTTTAEVNAATLMADAMHVSKDANGFSSFLWGSDVNDVWVTVGVTVTAANTGAAYRELGLVFDLEADFNPEAYGTLCVIGHSSSDYLQVYASPNGASDFTLTNTSAPYPVDTFSGTIRAFYHRGRLPQVSCTFDKNGTLAPVTGTRTPPPTAGRLAVFADDVDAEVRYVFIVTKP